MTDDGLSDDLVGIEGLSLPDPDMCNLVEIENTMRMAIHTATGRDTLTKFIIQNDYVAKLCPLVSVAEDFESLSDLHRLCSVMKSVILLNDNTIMEMVVRDDLVEGVVGALECGCFKFLADSLLLTLSR
jgi:protein phosphatase-4 regulatory subunit 3